MILVAGATGSLGSEICRRLRARGERVRGLVRTTSAAEKVAGLQDIGVEIVRGDLKDRASLDAACAGADVVISTVSIIVTAQPNDSFDATDSAGNIALIDAAKEAGVRQFVFVSFDTSSFPDAPLITAKRNVEAHLKSSGMEYSILQPTFFMEVWLGPHLFADPATGTARVYGEGTQPVSYVGVGDVAEVAVKCVNSPEARNATFTFGGELLTQRDALRIFEDTFKKRFAVVQLSEETLESQWRSAADPFTRTFSSLMLGLARAALDTGRQRGTVFPDRWQSVQEYTSRQAEHAVTAPTS
jgi:NADH dehydrogenase